MNVAPTTIPFQRDAPLFYRRRRSRFTLAVLLFAGAACSMRAEDLPHVTRTQIDALLAEKGARSAAQQKLDSQLVLALKKSRGEAPFDKPTALQPDLVIQPDGRVLVDLEATVSKELLARIESGGGKVIHSFEAARAIRALMPLASLETLAARADVKFIAPAAEAATDRGGAAQGSIVKP